MHGFFFRVTLFLTLSFTAGICYAQAEENPETSWDKFPVQKVKYPRGKTPFGIDPALLWKITFEPTVPAAPLTTKDQVIVFPSGEYQAHEKKLIMGPPESGIALAYWGISGFFSPTKEPITTVNLISLKHGKAITKQLPCTMNIYGISPNGKYLAVTPEPRGNWPKMNNLFILRIDDGTFNPVTRLRPFDDSPSAGENAEIVIRDVHWMDNKHLFIVSENNLGILLDLSTQSVIYGIRPDNGHVRSPFIPTPDKKYILALHDVIDGVKGGIVAGMGIYEWQTGKQLGYLKLSPDRPDKADHLTLAEDTKFTPNGRLMASRGTNTQINIWDFFRANLIGNYPTTVGDHWDWVNNRFLLIQYGGIELWDAKESIICSKFEEKAKVYDFAVLGEKLYYLATENFWEPEDIRLVCSQVIPPNMDEFLKNAERRKERLMGRGDDICLEFELRLNGSDKNRVEEHVKKQCENNGWNIVPKENAKYRLVAYMTEPEDEINMKLTFHGSTFEPEIASAKVRPYTIGYCIYKENEPIFACSERLAPYRQYESKEEFTRHLNEGMREKPDWFIAQVFPETITRGHMENEKNNATITIDGIVFQ